MAKMTRKEMTDQKKRFDKAMNPSAKPTVKRGTPTPLTPRRSKHK
ncbi:MAG TPA: hypothetical protein VFC84_14705 [Desulfosporosinus sp.]|nr:hypothetical protein [Desulfosporosinus sp.]